jgi:RHS repeat-associated protein
VQLDGRTQQGDFYRFGYQGSEKDDESKGSGNSYTTFYRQLDPRVGRWLSIDPKAKAWESPYVSMGNNPIWYNDKFGDTFDPASQKEIDGHKASTKDRIKTTNESIKYLEQKILDRGTKGATAGQQKKIDNLKSDITEYNDALTEITELENSTQMYTLNKTGMLAAYGTGVAGRTHYANGVVLVDYVDESSLAHELKHAYQFEKGEVSFDKKTGEAGYLHDANDEVEAYKREGAYDGDFSKRNMTAAGVRARSAASYGSLLNGPLNVNSTLEQVFRGRTPAWNQWLNNLPAGDAQLLFGPNAPLLNDIIK